MTKTSKEIREKLVMDRHEKKFNRDELLSVLEGSKSLDEDVKKRIEKEILENFYENFDKAKENSQFQSADAEYREIKKNKAQLKKASKKLYDKKLERKDDLKVIDQEMFGIAKIAMGLNNESWSKRRELRNTQAKRDELKKQQKKIQGEINELAREKEKLQKSLKEKEEKYGTSERVVDENKKETYKQRYRQRKIMRLKEKNIRNKDSSLGLAGYKEKYFQIIAEKEAYIKNLLMELENMDLGIDEEKKREVIELAKLYLEKDIATEKLGSSLTMEADKEEKWLEENRKTIMEELLDLKKKMAAKEKEIKENEVEVKKAKENGASLDELFEIRKVQLNLRKEQISLKQEYESIESNIAAEYERYTGEKWDSSKMSVETWDERENRINKKKEREELIRSHEYELDELERHAQNFARNQRKRGEDLRFFNKIDTMAVKNEDNKVGFVELFFCRIFSGYHQMHEESSIRVFVKVGDYVDEKKIVFIDFDGHIDGSQAYSKIIDAKIEGDILKVRLGNDEGEKGVMYEFKIDETKNIFIK